MQLLSEAEKIRNGLLQESFTIRRSMELSLLNEGSTSTKLSQDWLTTMEKLHLSLAQLSDRLSPTYIEDSLPLAMQCVAEYWLSCNSQLKIEMELPANWRQEPLDRSWVVLRIFDELLRITLSECLTKLSIHISLKQQANISELIVQILYPNALTLASSWRGKDLEYLSQTFQFLTSGQCFCRQEEQTVIWYFHWMTQSNEF